MLPLHPDTVSACSGPVESYRREEGQIPESNAMTEA